MSTVSGVIINHNGGEQILRCLSALDRQQPPLAESIVVDDGSTDDPTAIARRQFL